MPNWYLLAPIMFNTNRKLGGHSPPSDSPIVGWEGPDFLTHFLLIVWPVYSCILDLVTILDRQVLVGLVGWDKLTSLHPVFCFLHKAGWDKLSENMAPRNHKAATIIFSTKMAITWGNSHPLEITYGNGKPSIYGWLFRSIVHVLMFNCPCWIPLW